MQYVIDIILIAIFAIIVAVGAKKGFFTTLFELVAYIVSLIAAKMLSAGIAPVIFANYFYKPITQNLTKALENTGSKNYAAEIDKALDSIPEQLNGIMQLIGIDKESIMNAVSENELSGKHFIADFMDKIVSPVATAIIQTILFIAFAFILSVVLRLIIKLLDKFIKKLPVISQVNTSLGLVIGALKGLIAVVMIALIIGSLSGLTKSESFIQSVNDSMIINAIRGVFTSISGYSA